MTARFIPVKASEKLARERSRALALRDAEYRDAGGGSVSNSVAPGMFQDGRQSSGVSRRRKVFR